MKYKTHDGKEVEIKNMNSYHLEAAIKRIIRLTVVKYYDSRFKLGYIRTPTKRQVSHYIACNLAQNKIYANLRNEHKKREGLMTIFHTYLEHIDNLCRKEWSLYFRLQKVSQELRK